MALPEFELPDPDKEDAAAEDAKFEVEIEDRYPHWKTNVASR